MLYFELLLGPMYSSKSGELRRRCSRYRNINMRVLLCKPAVDTRTRGVHARDHADDLPCAIVGLLCDLLEMDEFRTAAVVAVDEVRAPPGASARSSSASRARGRAQVQFFPDAAEFVRRLERDEPHRTLIACGLSGDSDRRPWPVVSELAAMADRVDYMQALCQLCERAAIAAPFTRCLSDKTTQVAISGDACRYIAVCRAHSLTQPAREDAEDSAT